MKNIFLLLIISTLSLNSYSQIEFERGYFINDSDQKIDCLIKDLDWKNNPDKFDYRLTENSTTETASIKDVIEFGSANSFKFIRAFVKMDRSSENIGKLSREKEPIFNDEELFLKVLIEGKSSLYMYSDGGLKRYFYSNGNSEIKQLIYKKYKTKDNKLGHNNRFKQQLFNEITCGVKGNINNLKYNRSSLSRFFRKNNQCNNSIYVDFEKTKKDLFNLTIRPRLYSTALTTRNIQSSFKNTDFGSKSGFGFGIEAEFIMPFQKNKWAFIIESNFQSFKATKTTDDDNVSGGILIAEVNYRPIEIPIGLRHYYFINKNSKVFANISYVLDINKNSTLEYKRGDDSTLELLEIDFIKKIAFGLGYKFKDKFSAEVRYKNSRKQLGNTFFWNAEHNTISMIFGYSLF